MRKPPLHSRLWTWFIGFLMTGKLAHGVSQTQLDALSPKRLALSLSPFAITALGAAWFYLYVPVSFAAFLALWVAYVIGLRVALWALVWGIGELLVGYDKWQRRRHAPR